MGKKLQNQQYLKYKCHLAHQTHYLLLWFSGYKQHAKENSFCVWSFLCINIFYNFLRNYFNSVQKMLEATVDYLTFFQLNGSSKVLCDSNNCQFYQIAEFSIY